jgi:hypothetical protein
MKILQHARAFALILGTFTLLHAADADWQVLFDGESMEEWRGYKRQDFPTGSWKVQEGILSSVGGGERVDIITRERYTDFDLELEWRVGHRGNSGIFFRVSEEASTIWHYAPEYQILDDEGRNVPLDHVQATGSLYDLLAPNERKKLKPAGEFNHSRIVVRGEKVEHWLNGEKILTYDLSSEDVKERIARSKFREFEQFGRVRDGYIGLQHHGDSVSFKNIRIRRLSEATE